MVSAATELGSESGALNGALPLVASPKPAAPKRFVRQQVGWPLLCSWRIHIKGVQLQTELTLVLQVPDELLHNEALNSAIGVLPANYSFEVGQRLCGACSCCFGDMQSPGSMLTACMCPADPQDHLEDTAAQSTHHSPAVP